MHPADGALKLLVTTRALHHRRANRATFERGSYLPLVAAGEHARHVAAFARAADRTASITVAGRLLAALSGTGRPIGTQVWADTRLDLPPSLPPGPYREIISGGRVTPEEDGAGGRFLRVGDVFNTLPVAILQPA